MLPKRERLSSERDIKAVLATRQYIYNSPLLRFVARDNLLESSRAAVVAPKKLGKAVRRNRLRRVFKAAFSFLEIRRGVDIVLFPCPLAMGKNAKQICQELERGIKNAKIS